MSLADRFYMRDSYHAPRMTTWLIVVLILDKISAHGLDSLTEEERKILEAARRRLDSDGGRR
jgi:hypothetical protein